MGKTCIMVGCGGSISTSYVAIPTGCYSYSSAYPCEKCGRLHTDDGGTYFNRPGNPVYLERGLVEEQHLVVWRFDNKTALNRHNTQKATIVGEVTSVSDLNSVSGDHLYCYNP